ncbi:MAG: hypothetical protein NTY31_01975 [Candidatus Falkowbacteria bacterium]|nr:hypothetical protein [Candidatus Falkowbacteria bacterium]
METVTEFTVMGEKQKVKVLFESVFQMKYFIRFTRNIIISIAEGNNSRTTGDIFFWKKGNDEVYKSIGYMDLAERDTNDTLWRVQPKRTSCVELGKRIVMFLTD